MKHLWSTPAFVRSQKIRARKRERRRGSARNRGFTRTRRWRSAGGKNEQRLAAPPELNLFDKPHDTIEYCDRLLGALGRQGAVIFMDLSAVKKFTSVSLLVLRAIMETRPRAQDTSVRGNLPDDPEVASEFKESGFFQGFAKPPDDLPPPKGMMKKKSDTLAYPDVAAELVDFACEQVAVTRECANASSQNLVEIMTNTHNHAGYQQRNPRTRRQRHERWWASVYCRGGIAYFGFVDLGVGITTSAPAKSYRRKLQKSGVLSSLYGRPSLLKAAFEGHVGSVTGKPGRGLGLPQMKKHAEEKRLLKLRVLTSDVVGSVFDLDFRSARQTLRGTVFGWQTSLQGDEQ